MNSIQARLCAAKSVVPVVVIDKVADALPLAEAVQAGGGLSIEVTLRTDAGLGAIAAIAESESEIIVGAGTILTTDDAQQAIDAGAQFLVSPGFDAEVVAFARARNVLMIPGVVSPSEVLAAVKSGLDLLKFFPAELSGGAAMLKAFASVYPNVRFMPTGGVNLNNLQQYLALANVIAVGGSWVCERKAIADGEFAKISQLMQEAMKQV